MAGYLINRALLGWSSSGVPYSVAGAPHVPTNQRIGITTMSAAAFDYQADISNTPAGAWQFVFHHGGAYSVAVGLAGTTLFQRLIPILNAVLALNPITSLTTLTLPPIPANWGTREWAIFYALLRFQPSTMGPLERIPELNRTAAEAG